MSRNVIWAVLTIWLLVCGFAGAKQPPSLKDSAGEPIKYVGSEQTDKRFYHGALRQAVGVHRYQAFRANRTNPSEPGMVGWTYNHQPYLAHWNDQYYLQYLSDIKQEHEPPGRTLVMTSRDGRHWSSPRVVFPKYPLPEIKNEQGYVPAGSFAVMHQRMGLYVAPNGRLLTSGFYGYCPTLKGSPNNGKGLGRVIREIYKDNSLGPIYFIRYNRHAGWNESNTLYPFYKQSKDKGFLEACEALLADKLMTLQWWEEDRGEDGFYTIKAQKGVYPPKAFSWCHRPDGVVLGLWKRGWSALSGDDGQSWSERVKLPTLKPSSSKAWVQQTEDGRYGLVYTHSATERNRFPLCVMTSDDCHQFDDMLLLVGEVPPQRYQGYHKDLGVQYVRGIAPGNGDPPGKHIWNTYSVNKEDIWVSRTRVPISSTVGSHVNQDFENVAAEGDLGLWNLYIPTWGSISITGDPQASGNKCLQLRDEEPHDYVLAERIFPQSSKVTVDFRVLAEQVGHGVLCAEVHDPRGRRPMRLRFFEQWLWVDRGRVEQHPVPISTGRWLSIRLDLDCEAQNYDLSVNGEPVKQDVPFWEKEKVETLQRLVFRTGPWRGYVPELSIDREPAPGMHQEDLAGSDHRVASSSYLIDDVRTR
ncbi:MAG: hypothetical protein ACYTEL_00230 [Planctomycetota bacterium]|jgi:hypothetical protein